LHRAFCRIRRTNRQMHQFLLILFIFHPSIAPTCLGRHGYRLDRRIHARPQHNTQYWVPLEFYQLYPVLIRNSEGGYVLPDDGTWRPKHVGAIEGWKININKKLVQLLICSTYKKQYLLITMTPQIYKWTWMLHSIHAVTPCNLIGLHYLYLHWIQGSDSRHITFNRRSVGGNLGKMGLILTRKYVNPCVLIALYALG
jgi:hypothetical protein